MKQSPQRDGRGEAKYTDWCVEQKGRTAAEAGSKGWIGVDGVKYEEREERKRSFMLNVHFNYLTKRLKLYFMVSYTVKNNFSSLH